MSNPPALMRGMLHIKAKRFLFFALAASFGSIISWNVFYSEPRRKKYERFFEYV